MSVDLYSIGKPNAAFCGLSDMTWSIVLHLGQKYGWQPAGTTAPEGSYQCNQGKVSKQDALSLAAALELALQDVKNADYDSPYCVYYFYDMFREDVGALLPNLIAFFKKGAFKIR